MANYSNLISTISNAIKYNANNEITGNLLQEQLIAMINSLGDGYTFKGVAYPNTNPSTPDSKVLYAATAEGYYTNFANLYVCASEIAFLYYDGHWKKYTLFGHNVSRNESVREALFPNGDMPVLQCFGAAQLTELGLLHENGTIGTETGVGDQYHTSYLIDIPSGAEVLQWEGVFPRVGTYAGLVLYDDNDVVAVLAGGDYTTYGNSGQVNLSDYGTAKYLRFAPYWSDDFSHVKVVFRKKAILEPLSREIHIGEGQEFTTLRAGFEEAFKYKNTKVYIHPGTYDLLEEFAPEISAHSAANCGLFVGRGMHVIAMAGSYINANYVLQGTSVDDWMKTSFEPIRTDQSDLILENITIIAKNTRYCIHDEGAAQGNYTHKYINCRCVYVNERSSGGDIQCVGGGLGNKCTIEFDGGTYESYFTNQSGTIIPISYHNGNIATAESVLWFKNVNLINGVYRFGAYGPSTLSTCVYINGGYMDDAPLVVQEVSGGNAKLFDVWVDGQKIV